jgi:hypothetical protein
MMNSEITIINMMLFYIFFNDKSKLISAYIHIYMLIIIHSNKKYTTLPNPIILYSTLNKIFTNNLIIYKISHLIYTNNLSILFQFYS